MKTDCIQIVEEWHKSDQDCKMMMPDGTTTTFLKESKILGLEAIPSFFKSLLRNKKIELGLDIFPTFHIITAQIAKMYYATSNENHKANAMDILCYINTSLTYARLLDNV